MAHFALTDTAAGEFHAFERFARPPAASASTDAEVAQSSMFSGWLDDWSLTFDGDAWRVRARDGAVAVDLMATPETPILLQGDAGFSVKGAAPGNASHYYSIPRLTTQGSVQTPAGAFAIEGTSWLDREWSTSALEPGQVGWDWFALQLDGRCDLMFYRLRREDGATDPHSAGVFVRPGSAGGHETTRLTATDVTLTPARFAQIGAGRYPVAWQLRLPDTALGTELWVEARLPDQLHRGVFPYWEGAVVVRDGGPRGRRIGEGYVELTGY
jgi:Predicted secreted hydrolase